MILEILLVLLSLTYVTWLYRSYQKKWRHLEKIQGPRALPILGNVLQIGLKPEEYIATIRRWVKEYNFEGFRFYIGPQAYYCMANPKSIEFVLSSTGLTYKADVYDFLKPWLGEGLLTSNGHRWQSHRKVITPSFHFQILQDFLTIMNETTDRFMTLLGTYADKSEMFDFQEVITLSTMDVICECAMGTKVDTIGGNKSVIVNAMNDLCYVIQDRIFSIVKRPDVLFKLSSNSRIQERALKVMRIELSRIIEERRKYLETHKVYENKDGDDMKRQKMAFLDNLLTATVDGSPLTFEDIFEEVSTFVFEGHDTSATAIAFIIYCLSRHPEVQKRAYAEQVEIFGSDLSTNPNNQQLNDMKYLELVIKEGLRLYPSVPFILRTLLQNTEIDGKLVPEGTSLVISIIDVGTDSSIFPHPYEFQPERFENQNRSNSNAFDYVPFSAGPRNCIGQKFAMMELKVTISKMIRHFEILPAVDGLPAGIQDPSDPLDKPNNPYDAVLAAIVTLKSVNGLYIRLRKRPSLAKRNLL